MQGKTLFYKSINVLVVLAMLLVMVPLGAATADDDPVEPVMMITGVTAALNDTVVDLEGDLDSGYILKTTNHSTSDHYLQFSAGSQTDKRLNDDFFGLYLDADETTVDADTLEAYYRNRGVPEPYLSYLIAAANGEEPFVYIKGDVEGGTFPVRLVDAAQKANEGNIDVGMIIPDDFPVGTFTVEGKIIDLDDHETDVTLILNIQWDEDTALAWVQANTQLTSVSGTIADLKATFPEVIPPAIVAENYVIDSRITLDDALPDGITVTIQRNGHVILSGITLSGTGPFWFTELFDPAATRAAFNEDYGGAVEDYVITFDGLVGGGFSTIATIESIISKDDYFTQTVLGDISLTAEILAAPNTLDDEIASAPDYAYDPTYAYVGDWTFDGEDNTFTADYTMLTFDPGAMNDLARYLGALYRQENATIIEIEYNDATFTWNEDGNLKGSNWEDDDGTTLVSAIVDAYQAAPALPCQVEITVSDGVHSANVTFVLQVTSTLDEEIASAPGYAYDPPYAYVGDWSFEDASSTFTATYTAPEFITDGAMNDLARYLGALYRQDNSTIITIKYNAVTYTWNEAGQLKGSNWEVGGVTLVSVIVTDYLSEPGPITITVTDGVHSANVTFVLQVKSTLDEEIESAPSYAYDPPYAYVGDWSFAGEDNTFTAVYTMLTFDPGAMNDLARYLGALYRQETSTIVAIEYKGVTYTWNEAGQLKGSNWEAGDGTSLVAAIVSAYQADPVLPWQVEITVSDGVHTANVRFHILLAYTISASAGEGGSIEPSGEVLVVAGENQTFTISPDEGYRIADVFVDGESAGATTAYTFENVSSDHTIQASFQKTQTLTLLSVPDVGGLTDPGSGEHIFDTGTIVDITAFATDGYRFVNWTGDTDTVADVDAASTTIVMEGDIQIAANFILQVPLTVVRAGTGNGLVTSEPAGIVCGDDCTADFDSNASVTLMAEPATGSSLTGWSEPGCSGDTCTVTMDQVRTVTATFTLNQYQLTIKRQGQGTVSSFPAGIACGLTCSAMFDYGTLVTLSPVPAIGYSFSGWLEDEVIEHQILMTGDMTATAVFLPNFVIIAEDDAYEMAKDGILFIGADDGVLVNDLAPDEVELRGERIPGTGPGIGTLIFDADGSFTFTNLPVDFTGAVSFQYRACDRDSVICSEPAKVTIVVKMVPTAEDDTYLIGLESEVEVPAPGVLANDSGDDGAELMAFLEADIEPGVGDLTLNADGSFEFTVGAEWDGTATFTYRACDGDICSAPATVTIVESNSCLVPTSNILDITLEPGTTGALELTLSNTCDVPVDFDLLESGGVLEPPILNEGFENEVNPNIPPVFPPVGWETRKLSNRTWFLTEGSFFVDEGNFAVWVNFYNPDPDPEKRIISDEWLLSSVIDTEALDQLVLSFRANGLTYYQGATLRVWVTDTDGVPITEFSDAPLWDMLRDVDWLSRKFRTVQVDLNEFDNYGEIRIAWQYVTVNEDIRGESFGLDTIKIGGRSDVDWLSLEVNNRAGISETIPAGETIDISLDFDASGLNFGNYEAVLFVRNSPYPAINIPIYFFIQREVEFLYFLPLITN